MYSVIVCHLISECAREWGIQHFYFVSDKIQTVSGKSTFIGQVMGDVHSNIYTGRESVIYMYTIYMVLVVCNEDLRHVSNLSAISRLRCRR